MLPELGLVVNRKKVKYLKFSNQRIVDSKMKSFELKKSRRKIDSNKTSMFMCDVFWNFAFS